MQAQLDALPSLEERPLDENRETGAARVAELQREVATLLEMRVALDRIRQRMLRRLAASAQPE